MNDPPRIGPTAVPNDEELNSYFADLIEHASGMLDEVLSDLEATTEETRRENQPEFFTYGKMLSFLSDQPMPDLIHLCAAAMWRLNQKETDAT